MALNKTARSRWALIQKKNDVPLLPHVPEDSDDPSTANRETGQVAQITAIMRSMTSWLHKASWTSDPICFSKRRHHDIASVTALNNYPLAHASHMNVVLLMLLHLFEIASRAEYAVSKKSEDFFMTINSFIVKKICLVAREKNDQGLLFAYFFPNKQAQKVRDCLLGVN